MSQLLNEYEAGGGRFKMESKARKIDQNVSTKYKTTFTIVAQLHLLQGSLFTTVIIYNCEIFKILFLTNVILFLPVHEWPARV